MQQYEMGETTLINFWGPLATARDGQIEPYVEGSVNGQAGARLVQYFDKARMDKFFTTASGIYTKLGTPIDPKLKATDLYTNEFIDTSIGLK